MNSPVAAVAAATSTLAANKSSPSAASSTSVSNMHNVRFKYNEGFTTGVRRAVFIRDLW